MAIADNSIGVQRRSERDSPIRDYPSFFSMLARVSK